MRILKSVAALSTPLFLLGCMHTLRMPEEKLLSPQRVFHNLETQKVKRPRLSGRFKVKGSGIKQFLGSVDVIFALQQPSSFYLSIPSFFGSPARVVSSDGQFVYLLDLSTDPSSYSKEPITPEASSELLGFKIEPRDFVNALLGVVDLESESIVDAHLIKRNKRFEVVLRDKNQRQTLLELDSDTDDLLMKTVSDAKGRSLFSVSYADFQDHGKQRFPNQITVHTKSASQNVELLLLSEEIVFDDAAFDLSTFQMEEP